MRVAAADSFSIASSGLIVPFLFWESLCLFPRSSYICKECFMLNEKEQNKNFRHGMNSTLKDKYRKKETPKYRAIVLRTRKNWFSTLFFPPF